jgi:hypothetical protein
MRLARRTAPLVCGAALAFGCAAQPATPLELCEALLASKRPGAEVATTTVLAGGGVELAYALPDEGAAGVLTCEVERSALGGPRLRAAQLDGHALSDTELVVRNANLLLDELYAIGSRRG